MSEFDWIKRALSPLTNREPGTFALKNDGAVLHHDPGRDIVISTDTLIENTHFLSGEDPGHIAQKALRVNLSDLAAMGAKPLCYTLNLALTKAQDKDFLEAFVSGLQKDQEEFSLYLLGGDTTTGEGRLTITMTLFGSVPEGACWGRSNACEGDYVYITGSIGEGVLGLYLRQQTMTCSDPELSHRLIHRHLLPQPRADIYKLAADNLVSAAIDISDGVIADLGHICNHSGVAIDINLSDLPIESDTLELCAQADIPIKDLAAGGDDYELVLCVNSDKNEEFLESSKTLPFSLKNIGRLRASRGESSGAVRLFDNEGRDITPLKTGWTHF